MVLGFVTCASSTSARGTPSGSSPTEREFLAREVARESPATPGRVRDALWSGRVWALGLAYFVLLAAGFGLTFFVPDLVQDRPASATSRWASCRPSRTGSPRRR